MRNIFIYSFIILVAVAGCRKTQEFPDEPVIEFKEIRKNADASGKDTSVSLVFSFTDGDGDLGFQRNETGPPFVGEFYYNVICNLQQKLNGQFVAVTYPSVDTTITSNGDTIYVPVNKPVQYNYRLPFLEPSSKNKAIKGQVAVDINTFGLPPSSRFEFYIYDRALHKSNVAQSSEFTVNN